MYRLFGNVPVGRSNETQMSADWMAIENRKKAREKSGKHQKRRKAPNHESACRRKGRSQRQKMEPGLCMARREFLLYSRARRFAAPCRVGYETGENYGKRRWKAVVENDSGTAYSIVRAATDSPVAEILGRGEQVAGCVHQFRSLRARPLLNGRRAAAGRSRRSGTVGNIR